MSTGLVKHAIGAIEQFLKASDVSGSRPRRKIGSTNPVSQGLFVRPAGRLRIKRRMFENVGRERVPMPERRFISISDISTRPPRALKMTSTDHRHVKPPPARLPGAYSHEAAHRLIAYADSFCTATSDGRWASWHTAPCSEARVQEVLWLKKSDIRTEAGIDVMCLPRTKDGIARMVPLNRALIDEAFLGLVKVAPDG